MSDSPEEITRYKLYVYPSEKPIMKNILWRVTTLFISHNIENIMGLFKAKGR